MTLYGIDLIQDQQGKYHLLEINGICSGMKGFEQIYGDNRVEEEVYHRLQERYGKITINNGSYMIMKYKKEHPFKYGFFSVIDKIPLLGKVIFREPRSVLLSLPAARVSWMEEKISFTHSHVFPFEAYIGQESAVISSHRNEELPHPLVNPYLMEKIAKNKFFTYQILKNSELRDLISPSTLLGLGFTHEPELEEILGSASHFVIKPILGSQGRGVEIIDKKTAGEHQNTRGPAGYVTVGRSPLFPKLEPYYLEDFVQEDIFSFQAGLGIIQPFIDSRQAIGKKRMYTSIRSIVCNEKFVDAYVRASLQKKVNLAQGAKAFPCKDKDEIASLSEKIVAVFEEQCMDYEPKNLNQRSYGQYIESRGKTTEKMRLEDAVTELGLRIADHAEALTSAYIFLRMIK